MVKCVHEMEGSFEVNKRLHSCCQVVSLAREQAIKSGERRIVAVEAGSFRSHVGANIGHRFVFNVFLEGNRQSAKGTAE